jgi:hypothetical protein
LLAQEKVPKEKGAPNGANLLVLRASRQEVARRRIVRRLDDPTGILSGRPSGSRRSACDARPHHTGAAKGKLRGLTRLGFEEWK